MIEWDYDQLCAICSVISYLPFNMRQDLALKSLPAFSQLGKLNGISLFHLFQSHPQCSHHCFVIFFNLFHSISTILFHILQFQPALHNQFLQSHHAFTLHLLPHAHTSLQERFQIFLSQFQCLICMNG